MQNLPVVMCVDRAGLVGADGETHHGVFDMSFFRIIPNLTILAPKDLLLTGKRTPLIGFIILFNPIVDCLCFLFSMIPTPTNFNKFISLNLQNFIKYSALTKIFFMLEFLRK